jgi:alpha-galactosidase
MKRLSCLLACAALSTSVALAEKFEGLALTPPMGWNTWNTFAENCNETLVKQTADALVSSGMRDAGYVYVVVDDCWSKKDRDENGNLVADPVKFPSGMKALGDYLHSKGLKFGMYGCAGSLTCGGYPGGRGHEFQDARSYAAWGVDYFKYDWCSHGTANGPETYRIMSDALKAAGRPIVFSLCEWGQNQPWLWAEPVGHLWRTTGDIGPGYKGSVQEQVGARMEGQLLDMNVGLEKYAGPGHWNDPDMLEVGAKGMSLAESRGHFSLWCMLAAPLIAGNDVRSMTPGDRGDPDQQGRAIAVDQDPAGPPGLPVPRRQGQGDLGEGAFQQRMGRVRAQHGRHASQAHARHARALVPDGAVLRRDGPLDRASRPGPRMDPTRRRWTAHDVMLFRLKPGS